MEFQIDSSKLNKVIEKYINTELKRLKNWIYGLEDFYDVYGEYDPSYIRAIEYTEGFDVLSITKYPGVSEMNIDVRIYSNVGDFDWDLLTYDLSEKIKTMFSIDAVDINVTEVKRAHEKEKTDI